MSNLEIPSRQEIVSAVRGKIVIITGAASGIGFATAQVFAASGAQVIIADLEEEAGKVAASHISENCIFTRCNVTSWPDQLALFATTYQRFNRIDIVICNAGIDPEIIFAATQNNERIERARKQVAFNFLADELETNGDLRCPSRDIMDVNLMGVVYGIKLGVHYMKKSGGGRLIVIGSAASYVPVPDQSVYCASKHAVLGLVRATSGRQDLAQENISVSMIAPWLTTTPMTQDVDKKVTQNILASSGTDVAMGVAYLATKPWESVNGKSIWVQGKSYTEVEDSIKLLHHSLMSR